MAKIPSEVTRISSFNFVLPFAKIDMQQLACVAPVGGSALFNAASERMFQSEEFIMTLEKSIGVSSTALILVLSTSAAQANFKGISINQITEFWVDGISQFEEVETESDAVAFWGENVETQVDPLDPSVADCGPSGCDIGLQENAFEQFVDVPPAPQVNWARGDAEIINPDVLNGNGAASNVAEVYSAPGVETPFPVRAEARNTLDGSFFASGNDVIFSFQADPFMEVWVSAQDKSGSNSNASLSFEISINDAETGELVFNWAPDGMTHEGSSNILGGSAIADAFSLNAGLLAFVGEEAVYDPCGQEGACSFEARATGLEQGKRYNLDVDMTEFARGVQKVPLPPTLVLMAAGLVGLGVVRRRDLSVSSARLSGV